MCQGAQVGDSIEVGTYQMQSDYVKRFHAHQIVSGISLLPWEDNYIGPHEFVDQGGANHQALVETIFKLLEIIYINNSILSTYFL